MCIYIKEKVYIKEKADHIPNKICPPDKHVLIKVETLTSSNQ